MARSDEAARRTAQACIALADREVGIVVENLAANREVYRAAQECGIQIVGDCSTATRHNRCMDST
jgi:hypothetical protein